MPALLAAGGLLLAALLALLLLSPGREAAGVARPLLRQLRPLQAHVSQPGDSSGGDTSGGKGRAGQLGANELPASNTACSWQSRVAPLEEALRKALRAAEHLGDLSHDESALQCRLQELQPEVLAAASVSGGRGWYPLARLHAHLGEYLQGTRFPGGPPLNASRIEAEAGALFALLERGLYPFIPAHFSSAEPTSSAGADYVDVGESGTGEARSEASSSAWLGRSSGASASWGSLAWRRSLRGRGLVTAVQSSFLRVPWQTIRGLREVLNCTLPVRVYYSDEADLAPADRQQLEALPGVTTLNLSSVFDGPAGQVTGFAIKPLALLASGFAEAVWFDADLMFLVSPEQLFGAPGYLSTGVTLFHDRGVRGWGSLGPDHNNINLTWVQEAIGPGSRYLRGSRAFNKLSGHEVDSSAVVVNSARHLLPMLAVAALNLDSVTTYRHVWGDKETFWLGFEIAQRPWAMNPGGLAALTFDDPPPRCPVRLPGAGRYVMDSVAHLGAQREALMIHFSRDKERAYKVQPAGLVEATNREWYAECLSFDLHDLRPLSQREAAVFKAIADLS